LSIGNGATLELSSEGVRNSIEFSRVHQLFLYLSVYWAAASFDDALYFGLWRNATSPCWSMEGFRLRW